MVWIKGKLNGWYETGGWLITKGETGSGQLEAGWVVDDEVVEERRDMLRSPPKLAMLDGLMALGNGGGEGGGVPLMPGWYEGLLKLLFEADRKAGFMLGEPGGVLNVLKTLVGRLKVDNGRALGVPREEGVAKALEEPPAATPEGVKREVVGKKVCLLLLLKAGRLMSELQASICSERFMRSW
jgi:hypothetical protein